MYTYQVYQESDNANERVTAARKSFGHEGAACYVISKDGQMQIIQFEGFLPHPGATLEESAQKHIAALECDAITEQSTQQ